MGLPKNIRQIRGAMSQVEFAKILGTGHANIYSWESGKSIPGGKYLKRIQEHFGVSVDWLLSGQGEPFPAAEQPPGHAGRAVYEQPRSEDLCVAFRAPPYNNKDDKAPIRVSDALVAASRVLDSGTSYATALFLNIQHFDRAIQAENTLHLLTEENKQLKGRVAALEKECEDLRKRLAALEERLDSNPASAAIAA